MMRATRGAIAIFGLAACLWTLSAGAGAVEVVAVAPGLHMLSGKGGNIGVFIGPDGTFLVDDQFAPAAGEILEAVRGLGGAHPRFLLNTHYHFDHTGGNEHFGAAGSVILAHDNVRRRLASGAELRVFERTIPPAPPAALPVITYDGTMSVHLNGQEVRAIHLPGAHTDGDTVVHFPALNVIHTGDIFFNGFFPFIDTDHGGSLPGMLRAVDRVLGLCDENTRIIPGHGPLATREDLLAYRAMLATAHERLAVLRRAGLDKKAAVRRGVLEDLDARWGKGLFTAKRWTGIVYGSVDVQAAD